MYLRLYGVSVVVVGGCCGVGTKRTVVGWTRPSNSAVSRSERCDCIRTRAWRRPRTHALFLAGEFLCSYAYARTRTKQLLLCCYLLLWLLRESVSAMFDIHSRRWHCFVGGKRTDTFWDYPQSHTDNDIYTDSNTHIQLQTRSYAYPQNDHILILAGVFLHFIVQFCRWAITLKLV